MATCEDCIHGELCMSRTDTIIIPFRRTEYRDLECVEKFCEDFKNKADFVEVPCRCRDCVSCEIVTDQFDNDWYFCNKTKDNAEVKPNDFCSYGERKEDK